MSFTAKTIYSLSVAIIVSTFSSIDTSFAQDKSQISEKAIIVQGKHRGKLVSIHQRAPNGSSGKVAVCKIPCKKTIELADPFFILFPPPRGDYGHYIRRNSEDAIQKDGTYRFDTTLKTQHEETTHYYRSYASDQNNKPKRQACLRFELKDLSERPKACFKNRPSIPPKSVRSGWCEVVFTVLPDGSTENVDVRECSEEMFRIGSLEAAKLFRYYPRIRNGQAVSTKLRTKVRYTLKNEKGKRVPAKGE